MGLVFLCGLKIFNQLKVKAYSAIPASGGQDREAKAVHFNGRAVVFSNYLLALGKNCTGPLLMEPVIFPTREAISERVAS